MTPVALRRVLRMTPREMRIRLACEGWKAADRVRSRVAPPRWDRRSLRRILSPDVTSAALRNAHTAAGRGDWMAAHVALCAHISNRASAFPLAARDLPATTDAIHARFPAAAGEAQAAAARILAGEYDLLGYRGLRLGGDPDWHADVVHGRRAPERFWAAVPYLDPRAGDHKIIWELNRHQHWLALGRASALTGDRRGYERFVAQLASWLAANPPLRGVNWSSMLELAFRSLSWMWALELFAAAGSASDPQPWSVDLLCALDRQLIHVERNLSWYFSPNTHLTGEALALYVGGVALPELRAAARRARIGREVLVREAARQIHRDGGHAELSTHYQRYSTDFYLLALVIARRSGDPAAAVFEDAARRQARFLRAIADDGGWRPQWGDDDGGQLFPVCGRPAADCRDTLATAAVLLQEPALAVGPIPEETYWLCGAQAAASLDRHVPAETARSVALAESGYFVSRTAAGDHLVFDAGPHGYLNGGHAHADALACTLRVGGRALLVDPGTATYTMDADLRDRFRSTAMHNTLVLDGRPQSVPSGPFHWASRASASAPIAHLAEGCDYFEGSHDGYVPRRHTRGVLALHGIGWLILDHVLGTGAAEIDVAWHLDPAWSVAATGPRACRLQRTGAVSALASSIALAPVEAGSDPLAFCSPVYGQLVPAPLVRAHASAELPVTVATFLPACAEGAAGLTLDSEPLASGPGEGWHGCAFRVSWSGGSLAVVAAVERTGLAAAAEAAPAGHRWGTVELQTDGRLAVLLTDPDDHATEIVLVNGSRVLSPRLPAPLRAPSKVPLRRTGCGPAVAPDVQQPPPSRVPAGLIFGSGR